MIYILNNCVAKFCYYVRKENQVPVSIVVPISKIRPNFGSIVIH
jgi:hypothetical protein